MLGGMKAAILKSLYEGMAVKNDYETDNLMALQRQSSVFVSELEGIGADYSVRFAEKRRETLFKRPAEQEIAYDDNYLELEDEEVAEVESEESSDNNSIEINRICSGRRGGVISMEDIEAISRQISKNSNATNSSML